MSQKDEGRTVLGRGATAAEPRLQPRAQAQASSDRLPAITPEGGGGARRARRA